MPYRVKQNKDSNKMKLNANISGACCPPSCLLECSQLELRAGYNTLIKNLSFKLHNNEAIAIVGPNGIGKTTLLRALAGISRPHSGSVYIMNEILWPHKKINFEHFAIFLANIPALFLDHSVQSNLEFYLKTYSILINNKEIQHALEKVGLKGRAEQTARSLSTGQKRRLTLAAILLIRPNLILADEITSGLDTDGRALCYDIFTELREQSCCGFIIAGHDDLLTNWCKTKINLHSFKAIASRETYKIRSLF